MAIRGLVMDGGQPITSKTSSLVGETLQDELEARGWSRAEFALMLGLSAQAVAEILGGDRPIASDLARRIGDALGTGAQLWLNLQEHPLSRRE